MSELNLKSTVGKVSELKSKIKLDDSVRELEIISERINHGVVWSFHVIGMHFRRN